jgi:hypothetical protein
MHECIRYKSPEQSGVPQTNFISPLGEVDPCGENPLRPCSSKESVQCVHPLMS